MSQEKKRKGSGGAVRDVALVFINIENPGKTASLPESMGIWDSFD